MNDGNTKAKNSIRQVFGSIQQATNNSLNFVEKAVPRILNKFRLPIAITVLVAVLIAVWCILSLVISDSIGMPRVLQRTVSFRQNTVYNHLLHNFDVDGEVIWANSDSAYIAIEFEGIFWERYRYVTHFIQRLSDPDSDIRVTIREVGGSYQYGTSTYFNIFDGQNTVRLPAGDIDGLQIRLGTRQHMSMIVDEITLSRFPVLPDWFVLLFVGVASILSITWYFVVFKGLGKWLLAHPWAIFTVILLLQTLMMVYYFSQKRGLFLDEMTTITQSVRHEPGEYLWQGTSRPDFPDVWHTPEYFQRQLTVQEGEQFRFATLLRWSRNVSIHSPVHRTQIHLVASFFPDTFNFWIGGSTTIFWAILTSIMLFMTSLLVFKDKLIVLLPSIVWGFSNAAMSYAVFIRFYAPGIFFFTAITYLALRIITERTKTDFKFFLVLGVTFFLGYNSLRLFLVYFAIIAIILLSYLLYKKKLRQIINCTITVVFSFGISLLLMPYSLRGFINRGIRQEALAAELSTEVHLSRVGSFYGFMSRNLFGENMLSIVIMCTVLLGIMIVWAITSKLGLSEINPISSVRKNISKPLLLLSAIILYFFIVARLALHVSPRYLSPIYPTIFLTLLLTIYCTLSSNRPLIKRLVLIAFSAFIVFSNVQNRSVGYLFQQYPNSSAIFETEESVESLIVINRVGDIGEGVWRTRNQFYDFLHFDRVFVADTIPEDFNSENIIYALDSISYGEGLYIAINHHIDTISVLNQVQQHLVFERAVHLYTKYRFHMYRIVW